MFRGLPAEFSAASTPLDVQIEAALRGAQVGLALVDRQLRYTWAVNLWVPQGREPIGATDRELYGAAGERMMALKAQALASESEQRDQLLLLVDGAERPFELTATPRRDASGAVTGLLCVMIASTAPRAADEASVEQSNEGAAGGQGVAAMLRRLEREVAVRRQAEERLARLNDDLQQSRDLMRTIFDGIDDGLLLLDRLGTVRAANQGFAALWGLGASELIGLQLRSMSAPPETAFPHELIQASLADGLARGERVRFVLPDGRARIFDLHTLPLAIEGRYLEQLVVHLRDVSEQVKLEAQMIESERFMANQHLAAAVAHEVNTPLQAIESCLHLAGKLGDAVQRDRYLRLAREEIQRVGHILRQLLDLYRPAQGARSTLLLNDLVERALLLVGSSLARNGVRVEQDLAVDLPTIVGRAEELTQVLLNLILNAMHAMGRGGRLSIRTRYERHPEIGPSVALTVSDNGPGVAATALERIFEPFFTTKPDGHGLGLAVTQRIVAAHGGAITVNSVPGEGASFSVTLPLEYKGASLDASEPIG
jgi:two-component system sporulation sensor kinase A